MGDGPSERDPTDPEVTIAEVRGRIEQLEAATEEANREILKRLDRIERRHADHDEAVRERVDTLVDRLERAEERIWELETELEQLRGRL